MAKRVTFKRDGRVSFFARKSKKKTHKVKYRCQKCGETIKNIQHTCKIKKNERNRIL